MLGAAGIPAARAQAPTWSVDPGAFEQNLGVVAAVSVGGTRLSHAEDRLAAFVGSEVRGVAEPIAMGNGNLYFLTVYANVSGETVTFKAYDAQANVVRNLTETITFTANTVLGTVAAPQVLTAAMAAAPAVPTLSSPAAGATGMSTSPTLSWGTVTGATSYDVQMATDAAFATVVSQASVSSTSYNASNLSSGTLYYWRVRAAGAGGVSAYSAARSFTTAIAAPGVPTLVNPADGASGVALPAMLTWAVVTGATGYNVQVARDVGFTTVVASPAAITGTSTSVAGLSNATTYYWRVQATGAGGLSAYTAARSFTTVGVAPGTPALTSPAAGATGVSLSPALSWGAVAGATSYDVQVSTDAAFATLVVSQSAGAATNYTATLGSGTVYYWRVRAVNAAGAGAYSVARSFTTIAAAPSVPMLTLPAAGATGVSTSPTLSWGTVTGATGYDVQLATDAAFSSIITNQAGITATSYVASGLSHGTPYFWRVRAVGPGGAGAFAAARNFTTIAAPALPSVPVLSSPAAGATGVPTSTALSWAAAAGATSYELQVATDAAFASVVVNQVALTGTTFTTVLLSGTMYHWRVRAVNAAGTSAYSASRSFTTIAGTTSPSGAPALLSPAQGATGVALSPTFAWGPTPGATSYDVQVSTEAGFGAQALYQPNVGSMSLIMSGLAPRTTYYWRVRGRNEAGQGPWSGGVRGPWSSIQSFATGTSVAEEAPNGSVMLSLAPNHPNPFTTATQIRFSLPVPEHVRLDIVDAMGRTVDILVDGLVTSAGWHDVRFEAGTLTAGVYYCRLKVGMVTQIRPILLLGGGARSRS